MVEYKDKNDGFGNVVQDLFDIVRRVQGKDVPKKEEGEEEGDDIVEQVEYVKNWVQLQIVDKVD